MKNKRSDPCQPAAYSIVEVMRHASSSVRTSMNLVSREQQSNVYFLYILGVREGRAGVDGKSFSKNGQMERQEGQWCGEPLKVLRAECGRVVRS